MTRIPGIILVTVAGVLLAVGGVLLTQGCSVGPDFQKPAPPDSTAGYSSKPLGQTDSTVSVAGGGIQHFIEGKDIPGEWWSLFRSKPLNDLIERSLKNNPSLKAAQASLLVARENVMAQHGAYYPNIAGSLSAGRQKTSSDLQPTPASGDMYFSLYTPQVGVSYVPDVFGLNRRTVEGLAAQAEQVRFALAATHITLTGNIVASAIQEAALRAEIGATRELITINDDMVDILRKRFEKGYSSKLDLAAQESQLAQIKATLPPLMKQLAQQRDLLAALSGSFPSEAAADTFELSKLDLPEDLPVSFPSQLVEQRPDIRQAEENLHAASAQIGVAVANRFPLITLTADLASMALDPANLFKDGTGVWGIAGNVTQPLFNGGTLSHKESAARAGYTEAAELYRATVITAFQNVADALRALEQDAEALKASAAAKDAAAVTLDLARKQWQAGYANYLALLSAEQTYEQALINLVQAQSNRYSDTAALFVALGGGWWNRKDLFQE